MKLFGQIVRTMVNIALVPVAVIEDVVTLGGTILGDAPHCTTAEALQRLKDEASEDDDA